MSTLTTYMGLTGWDLPGDYYSHTQLANNFVAIDGHDHTVGKGKQIPTGGIADGAITTVKLADNAVTSAKIADGAITYPKISAGARPWGLGDLKLHWFPSGGSPSYGLEWHIADGSTLTAGQHDFNGGVGSVILPNLINAFPFAVAQANVGSTGGSNTLNLAHNHTVNAHTHSVPAHTHGISADGSHQHLFGGQPLVTRENAFLGGIQVKDTSDNLRNNSLESLFSPAYDAAGPGTTVNATMDGAGSHSHGGATASGGAGTSGSANPATNSALGSTDTRPAFVGFLPLIRIRN